jgi:protein tyrosine phosphatase (PTP) superfamily phosphohydrolase (DUF442 family)
MAAQAPAAAAAPGIRRFAGVETKLAGGSLPTASGLDWLVEKGYKTILDLREDADLSPAFIADVTRRGLRYLPLPINVKAVDADHVSRFNFEVSLAEARPLYFCDTDGTRAGMMWYIRRVSIDKVDPETARRDAEELGLSDPKFWLAANAYLDTLKPAPTLVPAPSPAPPSPTQGPASAPAPAGPPLNTPKPAAVNAPEPPTAGPRPGLQAKGESAEPGKDLAVWKPMAAVVVTGLGVPLAFLSRSNFPASLRSLARASLPGQARSTKSLPSGSDG